MSFLRGYCFISVFILGITSAFSQAGINLHYGFRVPEIPYQNSLQSLDRFKFNQELMSVGVGFCEPIHKVTQQRWCIYSSFDKFFNTPVLLDSLNAKITGFNIGYLFEYHILKHRFFHPLVGLGFNTGRTKINIKNQHYTNPYFCPKISFRPCFGTNVFSVFIQFSYDIDVSHLSWKSKNAYQEPLLNIPRFKQNAYSFSLGISSVLKKTKT